MLSIPSAQEVSAQQAPWPWVQERAQSLPGQGRMEIGLTLSLKAVVPPWHSKCSGDPPAMAEWSLQGRGTWAEGQHCLLKPDPGRKPCCDPWPGSSGTTHHPLPHRTDWQHHPAPLSPLSPTECSATRTHSTDGVSRELAPGHPMRGLRDPQGQAEPAPSQHCACLPCRGFPMGPHRVSRPDLLLGRPHLKAPLLPQHLRECQTGRYQCLSSTHRHWAATPASSSGGFLNSINLPTQIKLSGIFGGVCWAFVSAKNAAASSYSLCGEGTRAQLPCGDRSPEPPLYP